MWPMWQGWEREPVVSGKKGVMKAGGSLWKQTGECLRDLVAGKIFLK